MTSIANIIKRAKTHKKHIVLAEGMDIRIVEAGVKAAQQELAHITLLGPESEVRQLARKAGDTEDRISVIDPKNSEWLDGFAAIYFDKRKHKGMSQTDALLAVQNPLNFANLMVQTSRADGSVAGAIHTTSDVVRSALQILGVGSKSSMVSSFFIMIMDPTRHGDLGSVIYSDCGLVIDPDSDELVEIAQASAQSAQLLLALDPKVAMLSFATGQSARHARVDKVLNATTKFKQARPDLSVDGPLQFDAATVPDIADRKAPGSPLAGKANVFIFPDLDAGNIAYKITERIGGAKAIGPILQGLAKPANDLSRGCDAEAVFNMIAVTAVQAAKP